jgi:raffinose/stachyose/melibiose transport system permease protein
VTSTLRADSEQATEAPPGPRRRHRGRDLLHLNWIGGLLSFLWLAVVIIPIYWIVITSLKSQEVYFSENPLKPPTDITFESYRLVIQSHFIRFFFNSVIVTLGSVVPAVLIAFMAAFAIIRGRGRFLWTANTLFLMGLAVPLQATIIPVYLARVRRPKTTQIPLEPTTANNNAVALAA